MYLHLVNTIKPRMTVLLECFIDITTKLYALLEYLIVIWTHKPSIAHPSYLMPLQSQTVILHSVYVVHQDHLASLALSSPSSSQ